MPLWMHTTWFGTFLIQRDEARGEYNIVKFILFPQEVSELAQRLNAIASGELLDEEVELAEGVEGFYVHEPRLAQMDAATLATAPRFIVEPEDYGFAYDKLHEATIAAGKLKLSLLHAPDRYIIQAVNAIDDLLQTANLLTERLHEWSGLRYPEKMETEGVGAEFPPADRGAVQEFAKIIKEVNETLSELEKYVKSKMVEVAPNISHLATPLIGARLIALAGGLERLAKFPASTVQMLGAERALFRHLKNGSRPPKHGIIYQHPTIHRAPYWQRGKLARTLAGKLAIAAKMDHHSDKFIGDKLEQDFRKRVDEIKKRYPKPPTPPRGKGRGEGKPKRERK